MNDQAKSATMEWVKVLTPILIAAFASFKGCEAVSMARATDERVTAFVTEQKFKREVRRLDRRVDSITVTKGRAGSKAANRGPGTSSSLKTRALNILRPWKWFGG